jgi:hypothetical protein
VVAAVLSSLGLAVIAVVLLLRVAGHDHALQIDAIKTGLSVGAAGAGVFALLMAVQRLRLAQRKQIVDEYDAAERRVTELYTKAGDQLGNDKAAVRLAGLYALERLAQDNPTQRQTIVNVKDVITRLGFVNWADAVSGVGRP